MNHHLTPDIPAPAGMACRLCGSHELLLDYTQGNHDEFRFYRCPRCQLVNYDISAGLDQEKYERVHPDPLAASHPQNRAQTETFRFLSRHLSPPGRLLEIGCGNGRLLHLAQQGGWTVSGIELSPALASSVTSQLGIPVEVANILEPGLSDRLGPGRFDVIVLRHVLEHLPDPHAAMALFHALLVPNGHVVLEFPNIDGLTLRWKRLLRRSGISRKSYRPGYHPGHCNEYGRESFGFLARRHQFDVRIWQTYSHHPLTNWLVNRWPFGIKARTILRATSPVPFSSPLC